MSTTFHTESGEFLYQQVVSMILRMTDKSTLRPGDKLPSLRSLSRSLDVSVPTVRQGYIELERLGAVSYTHLTLPTIA